MRLGVFAVLAVVGLGGCAVYPAPVYGPGYYRPAPPVVVGGYYGPRYGYYRPYYGPGWRRW